MAEYTAKRIEHFLGLPVTVVTDEQSLPDKQTFKFNDTIIAEPDATNIRDKQVWINKGRYQAYEFSPYDETLLLDTDYMVNSNKLNTLLPLTSETTQGVTGDWNLSKYHPIVLGSFA